MPYCEYCGVFLEEDFEYCPECGAHQSVGDTNKDNVSMRKCPDCGNMTPSNVSYCLSCGAIIDRNSNYNYNKSFVIHEEGLWRNKWVSLILCILFGWIGAHKYYEGKVGIGILYTFTFGLLLVGVFIDVIILLFKPNPYLAKR